MSIEQEVEILRNIPMFAKIEVNGEGACDLYKMLKAARAGDDGKPDIAWNFTKFLVGRDGQVLRRFAPPVTPQEIAEVIMFLCSEKASYVTGQVIAADGGFESTGVGLPALRD